jgi:hypothetical protein
LTEREIIKRAWDEEGSITRLDMRPATDLAVQDALIPPRGDWRCVVPEGRITRSIVWNDIELAQVNPRGDMPDRLEGEIAMGLRAAPVMDRALRVISVLAADPTNLQLICRIARAAIDYVEQPSPEIPEPEET